jgi:hypothetical protein
MLWNDFPWAPLMVHLRLAPYWNGPLLRLLRGGLLKWFSSVKVVESI